MSYDLRTIAFAAEILYPPLQLRADLVQAVHNTLYRQPGNGYQNFQVAPDGIHLGNLPQAPGQVSTASFAWDRLVLREELRGTTVEDFATRMVNVATTAFQTLGITATLNKVDDAQYKERTNAYDFDMTHYIRSLSLSPGNEQTVYWGAAGVTEPGTRNWMGMNSPAADALIGDLLATRDDQIEFYKSKPKSVPDIYYADVDGDGYGMEGNKIEICSGIPPAGYARIKGDCDDTNAAIHPSAIEIQCNAIDENCNGNEDDSPDFNPILVQADIKHSTCNGSHDGEISLQISGGTSPYTVLWNNGLTGSTISQLPDGIYYAKITDFGGCKVKTAYFQVNILTNLKVIITELTKPSCKGRSDGVIAIEHNNENGPYQYLWSNGAITKNLTNVPEGMYHVTVTDINNCFATLNNIALTSKPSVITGIATIKHPLCNGLQTGQISLITVNGLPPYNYKWSTGDTTDQISNLPAGIYKVTVPDAAGCNTEFETKITEPEKINIKIVSTEAVRCFGENNGSIKTDVSGGTAPYTFLWNSFADRTDDIFGLTAGDYMLTVTDANGCKNTTEKINIQQPMQFVLHLDSNAVRLALERRRETTDRPPPVEIPLPEHVQRRDTPVRPYRLEPYDRLTEATDDAE